MLSKWSKIVECEKSVFATSKVYKRLSKLLTGYLLAQVQRYYSKGAKVIKQTAKNILSEFAFLFRKIKPQKGVPILMYHLISEPVPQDALGLCVPPKCFQEQMEFLYTAGYQVIPLANLVECIRKGTDLPEKGIVITFDDGYRDNYTQAFPVLKKFGFHATIFVATDFVGTKLVYESDVKRGVKWLREHFSWLEIEEMSESGLITFGSHTLADIHLTRVTAEEAERQLLTSKEILEDRLGDNIKLFSYPHGAFDTDVKQLVESCGYDCASTTVYGANDGNADVFELKRIGIYSTETTLREFKKKLAGAYNFLNLLQRR